MTLSNEAIISLIGVIANLPTALLVVYKLWMRVGERINGRGNQTGKGAILSFSLIYPFLPLLLSQFFSLFSNAAFPVKPQNCNNSFLTYIYTV